MEVVVEATGPASGSAEERQHDTTLTSTGSEIRLAGTNLCLLLFSCVLLSMSRTLGYGFLISLVGLLLQY